MKTNLKQKFLRTVMGGMGALMLLTAPNAFAFPTSGTCAMLVTFPVPVGASMPFRGTYNILATITFTSDHGGTLSSSGVELDYTTTGYTVVQPLGIGTDIPFTLAPSFPPGARKMTFTAGRTIILNLYAVNGDRTILVQGINDAANGVCQFI